jgi:hypothetical protein
VDASNGDIVIGGQFYSTIDLGTGPLMVQGSAANLFIARYDCTGKPLWGKRFGSPLGGGVSAPVIAIDGQHATLVTGSFAYSIDFGCGPLSGSASAGFVAKLDASGACVFSKPFGGTPTGNIGQGIAADASGNVLVGGYYQGTTDFGGGPVVSAMGGMHTTPFLLQLDPAGNFGWLKQYGDSAALGFSMARDVLGNVLFCGATGGGGLDFGGGPLPNGWLYLAKVDAKGAFVWSKTVVTNAGVSCSSLTTDASGNLLFGGSYIGTPPDLGGGPLPAISNPLSGGFVAKLSAAGDYIFAKGNGGTGDTSVDAVAADASGALVFTGLCTDEPFSFGGPPQTGSGNLYVAQVAPGGMVGSAKFFGLDYGPVGPIAVAPSGMLVVGGQYAGTLDFGNGPLPMQTQPTAFLAQIPP